MGGNGVRTPLDRALAGRIEAVEGRTLMAWFSHASRPPAPGVLDAEVTVADGAYCMAWPGMRHAAEWQRTIGLGTAADASGEQLDAVLAFYRQRGLSAAIEVCPYNPSLLKLCAASGLKPAWFTSVLVAFPNTPLPESPSPDPDLRLHVLVPGDLLIEEWSHSYVSAFQWDERSRKAGFQLAAATVGTPGMTCYAVCLGARVIGGGALYVESGAANLHGAWVLPAYRGRGAQSLLVRQRLADAVRAGCDVVTVQTGVGTASQRNLERLGFRLAYTRVVMHTEPA